MVPIWLINEGVVYYGVECVKGVEGMSPLAISKLFERCKTLGARFVWIHANQHHVDFDLPIGRWTIDRLINTMKDLAS